MTTSLSTGNPLPIGTERPAATPGLPGDIPGLDATAPYANEFLVVVPGAGALPSAVPAAPANPGSAVDIPNEDDLRKIPAALAGVSGQGPVALAQAPTASDADAGLYFLKAVPPTSPGVVPLLRPDRPGTDPNLNSVAPVAISTANPRAPTRQRSVPGSQHGSTPPHTPGVELGSQPFAGAVPPASAFPTTGEEPLRAAPGVLADVAGTSPLAGLGAAGGLLSGSPPYFLEGTQPTPRIPVDINLPARNAGYEPLPDLGPVRLPSPALNVPAGGLYFVDDVGRLGAKGKT